MSEIPAELRYASSHEWAKVEDGVATVGISDHAQDAMGDLVYVELPEVGQVVAAGDETGVVESVKRPPTSTARCLAKSLKSTKR